MTKIIVEQIAGADYPLQLKGNDRFIDEQKASIRRRLELRPIDIVEIREGITMPVSKERIYNILCHLLLSHSTENVNKIVDGLCEHFQVVEVVH